MNTVSHAGRSVTDRLEEFVRELGRVAEDDGDFNRQVHLFQAGYLDSLGVESLIVFIEDEFDIELSDESLNSPGFSTIDGISAIIDAELRAKGGAHAREPRTVRGEQQ
ncbi:acyl carrier protein [Sphaerisporangium rhizosphaerae]|uniref:Carrier domain-containing protein n=1 Tax=Sphaerisporangium rhizosphaerae TaxID=2269375 RepID=A0ABW2PHK4_9ACTN